MNIKHTQEAYLDALEMERNSILDANDEALPKHKRQGYAEMMYEAADMRRKEMREEQLLNWSK